MAEEVTREDLDELTRKVDALTATVARLSRSINTEPKSTRMPSIAKIKDAVCRRYGVTIGEIDSPQHDHKIVRPRHIAMYLAHRLSLKSLPEIGRHFGGRDHTTILNAKKKIAKLRAEDPDLAQELSELERALAPASAMPSAGV
jgi:chromosomal replication initiation ATPase DnaA